MNDNQRWFLEAYYKACFTSQPNDWHQAAMLAKQMYNKSERTLADDVEETKIADAARDLYE
jgi:hypothetical protein